MSEIRKNLKYTKTHEWVSIEGNTVKIGLTAYATEKMGKDLAYIELVKDDGDEIKQGEEIALLDVVKTTEEVLSPLSGRIVSVNRNLEDDVETLSNDPYGDGWVAVIEISSSEDLNGLLSPEDYEKETIEKGA